MGGGLIIRPRSSSHRFVSRHKIFYLQLEDQAGSRGVKPPNFFVSLFAHDRVENYAQMTGLRRKHFHVSGEIWENKRGEAIH